MSTSHQVKIGPEFFVKAKNDYANWQWALVREFMQNSMDCGSNVIEVEISEDAGKTTVTVSNDGEPMTEHILVNKLLSLGSSGKDFQGSVGGFGKAKELLYLCWDRYEIRSGNMLVRGCGAGYDMELVEDFVDGTQSTIIMTGCYAAELKSQLISFSQMCRWSGTLMVNGRALSTNLRKGTKRREFSWGSVYTNKTFEHRLIVRINGMPMFSRWSALNRCIVVELEMSSGQCLTSNRDGLRSQYAEELNAFIQEVAVDKNSALKNRTTSYKRYGSEKISVKISTGKKSVNHEAAAYATLPTATRNDGDPGTLVESDPKPFAGSKAAGQNSESFEEEESEELQFIVKNTLGMEVPAWFIPGSGCSAYSDKLANVWAKCLIQLHQLMGNEEEFSIGFVFDDSSEAEHEFRPEFGRVYLINPIVVVEQLRSRSRSLKKRWKFNSAGYNAILADVVHEYCHGGYGLRMHDENFASKLTSLMGVVMANRSAFNHCFK